MENTPDLLSLDIIDQLGVLIFVLYLYCKSKIFRPLIKRVHKYQLAWPISIACQQAILVFIILSVISVRLNFGSLIAIYGASLCIAILLNRLPISFPRGNDGRNQMNRDIIIASSKTSDPSR